MYLNGSHVADVILELLLKLIELLVGDALEEARHRGVNVGQARERLAGGLSSEEVS